MIRTAFWLLILFAAAVGAALLMQGNHGHLAILWPPYRIELSNNMALVALFAAFLLLYALLRVLTRLVRAPSHIRGLRGRRERKRGVEALQAATIAYFEGRFEQAEKLALQARGRPGVEGAAALIAAQAAQRLGAPQRRDEYLRIAARSDESQAAALQTQAVFALEDRRPDQAIEAVDRLSGGTGTTQRLSMQTALDAYRQSERWDLVLDTTRQMGGKGGSASDELQSIRRQAYAHMLAPRQGDARAIGELWKSLSADEKRHTEIASLTVSALSQAGAQDEAGRIALGVLDGAYDASTVAAYGAMAQVPAKVRLEQLERWRNVYGDRPMLLEMLGRICADERLWGKAETYLNASIAAEDSVSARVALGQLYESTQRSDEASRQYRAGARLSLGESQPVPSPVPKPSLAAGSPLQGAARTDAVSDASVINLVGTEAEGAHVEVVQWHPTGHDAAVAPADATLKAPSRTDTGRQTMAPPSDPAVSPLTNTDASPRPPASRVSVGHASGPRQPPSSASGSSNASIGTPPSGASPTAGASREAATGTGSGRPMHVETPRASVTKVPSQADGADRADEPSPRSDSTASVSRPVSPPSGGGTAVPPLPSGTAGGVGSQGIILREGPRPPEPPSPSEPPSP